MSSLLRNELGRFVFGGRELERGCGFGRRFGWFLRNEVFGSQATLRNELPEAVFLYTKQHVEGAMESALVGGVIAQEDGELLGIDAVGGEAVGLHGHGTLHEPVGLRELANEHFFGWIGGLVLVQKRVQKRFIFGGIFARNDELTGGESMLERIAGGSGFARRCARTGGTAGARSGGDAVVVTVRFPIQARLGVGLRRR